MLTSRSNNVKICYFNGDRKHDEDWRLRLRHYYLCHYDICIFAEMGKWEIVWDDFHSIRLDPLVGATHIYRGMQTLFKKATFEDPEPNNLPVQSERLPASEKFCERHQIEYQSIFLNIGNVKFQIIAGYHTGHTNTSSKQARKMKLDEEKEKEKPELGAKSPTKKNAAKEKKNSPDVDLKIDYKEHFFEKPPRKYKIIKDGNVEKKCCRGIAEAVAKHMHSDVDYVIFCGDVNVPNFIENKINAQNSKKKTTAPSLTEAFNKIGFKRIGPFGTHFQPKKREVTIEGILPETSQVDRPLTRSKAKSKAGKKKKEIEVDGHGDYIIETRETDVVFIWSKTGNLNPAHVHIHQPIDGFPLVRKNGEPDYKDSRHAVLRFELGDSLSFENAVCEKGKCDDTDLDKLEILFGRLYEEYETEPAREGAQEPGKM